MSRSRRFANEIDWYGDVRASVVGLPLNKQWITVSDREGHILTAEGDANQLDDILDLCQDQWDIFQQTIGRLFSLNTNQIEICSVLYRDGLSLDSAIEASKKL